MEWIRLLLPTKPYISQSCHDKAQDSLAPGGDKQVVGENAVRSRSPRAQGSLGHHGGHYNPSTVEQRERERVNID